ncbi:MAG: prepilin-type N-terminal cleavage/methylation domain-containing protein [Opitutaceae bacterium]|jgi:general secretion pathway protein G|nr:prepilin-type N-terminal cleavage/methylation domain-containing protein [Opitutaceae bacterium]
MKKSPCNLSAAFTLIELLTVIAIIGILAAIIIPTVGKVRETAKRAKSISNLRQLATAANLHASENRNKYPWMAVDGYKESATTKRWPNTLRPLIGDKTGTGKIFINTTIDKQSAVLLDPFVTDGNHHELSDYGANEKIFPLEKSTTSQLDTTHVATPSRCVLFCPTATKADPAQASWYLGPGYIGGTSSQLPCDRGNPGKILCGFADGHVSTIPATDLTTSSDRKRWFDPDP